MPVKLGEFQEELGTTIGGKGCVLLFQPTAKHKQLLFSVKLMINSLQSVS